MKDFGFIKDRSDPSVLPWCKGEYDSKGTVKYGVRKRLCIGEVGKRSLKNLSTSSEVYRTIVTEDPSLIVFVG